MGEKLITPTLGKISKFRSPEPEARMHQGEKITPIPTPEGRHPGRSFIMGSEGGEDITEPQPNSL